MAKDGVQFDKYKSFVEHRAVRPTCERGSIRVAPLPRRAYASTLAWLSEDWE